MYCWNNHNIKCIQISYLLLIFHEYYSNLYASNGEIYIFMSISFNFGFILLKLINIIIYW